MEKFGLLQLLSSFAKNLQEDNQNNNQQNILDVFMDNSVQNTSAIPPQQTNSPTPSNSIFTSEIRQKHFNNILLRHEEISRRIDKRNKH